MSKKNKKPASNQIVTNKKARHDFHVERPLEAGLVLEGWEVKSLRAGQIQLTDSFVQLTDGEAWLHGAHIEPLHTASSHVAPIAGRRRKLLLNRHELSKLFAATQQDGKTCVVLSLYWSKGRVKCSVALATGKKQHDKRAADKQRDWNREKQRVMRAAS